MKKIVLSLILLITIVSALPVNASNYSIRELIPVDTETTVVGDRFSYQGVYFNSKKEDADKTKRNYVIFKGITNITNEEVSLSVSIGLFGEDRKNIGTIHICDEKLQPKQTKPFEIEVTKAFIGKEFNVKDVKYISIIGENTTCRDKTGYDEFIGQKVEEIGYKKNNQFDSDTQRTFKVYLVIGGVLVALFLYAFMFTNQYKNMDGEDVRQGYAYKNNELKEEREAELKRNPPKPPEKKQIKTDEVLKQEQQEKESDKSNTDLHNMFK
jgi:hypothetical protein